MTMQRCLSSMLDSARVLNANAMQGRRRKPHKAPIPARRDSLRTPSTTFRLPLTVLPQIQKAESFVKIVPFSPRGRLRGKGDGWGGCGRGGKKPLGPYLVLSAPPALHFAFESAPPRTSSRVLSDRQSRRPRNEEIAS